MRGKVRLLYHRGEFLRITPAYAGKRHADPDTLLRQQDHPRLCGEKLHNFIFHKVLIGSPPPMRGKAVSHAKIQRLKRITPAYAGTSQNLASSRKYAWDHPRLCGEKLALAGKFTGKVGSPPPMRGKDITVNMIHIRLRITPAYAGKSSLCIPLKRHT